MRAILKPLTVALALAAAAPSMAQQGDQGLMVAMKISRSGTELMSPSIWGPLGATSRIFDGRGLTIEVTSEPATPTTVSLHVKVTEAEAGTSTTSSMSVELRLGSDSRIYLRRGLPSELVIQLAPRMTARPV